MGTLNMTMDKDCSLFHAHSQVPDSVQGPDPELLKLYEAAQFLSAEGSSSQHPGVAALAAEVLACLTPFLT